MAQRIKTVQESDLRMLGDLARSIQRVLPVTQADIDAAAALGKGWVVTRVFEVSDPLDNMRGGTQLVIRQNSILPGQNVQRVLLVSGPGGQTVVIRGTDYIVLPDAIANSLSYVKAFGGTEQRNIPQPYTQVNYVTNTASTAVDTGIMIDFAKNYEFEVEARAVSGSWYILQSRASASGNVTGIHGETSGSTIKLVVGNVTVCTSAITRTVGNKLYVKATLNAGTATLYVKDETANTEDTQTGSYGTSQPNPTAAVYLLGNAGGQYVDVNSDIYMARIKENDTVVMDYVPARQVATAGFYDTVSGTFKTALTPANLSADGNTVPTPDTPMDIVSNNGVLKVSRNLFNLSANPLEQGGISTNDGQDTSGSYDKRVRTNGYVPVKPNTVYTASVKDLQIYYFEYAQDKTYTNNHSSAFTDNSVTFTTGANTYFVRLQFRESNNAIITPSEVTNVQLEQGSTATDYMPYGQIYTDGTVETIWAHGKNLFDKNHLPERIYAYFALSGTKWYYIDAGYSLRFPCLPNTTYTARYNGNSTQAVLSFASTSSDAVPTLYQQTVTVTQAIRQNSPTINTPITITTGASDKWLIVAYNVAEPQNTDMANNLQIEIGSTATDYVPYYNGGTATTEMLLEFDTTRIDEQEVISGAITRKVGVIVFDGTENWVKAASYTNIFYTDAATDAYYNEDSSERLSVVCTHLQGTDASNVNMSDNTIKLTAQGSALTTPLIYVKASVSGNDLTTWKNWLATQYANGTPVIVIYPLKTPTTESVTPQPMQTAAGDNTAEITQASLNGLELEAQYQASVLLTIEEVQDANLDPNVEVTIN